METNTPKKPNEAGMHERRWPCDAISLPVPPSRHKTNLFLSVPYRHTWQNRALKPERADPWRQNEAPVAATLRPPRAQVSARAGTSGRQYVYLIIDVWLTDNFSR